MRHTRHCKYCAVELEAGDNWLPSQALQKKYWCNSCKEEHNNSRMYVNSKYVPFSHPLHKPGRYKTFEGAAFASLEGYTNTLEGYVYIINNPCWKGWVKIGMAIDAEDRCRQYQTSSPFRDFKLCYSKYFEDRKKSEQLAHDKLHNISTKRNGEWLKVSVDEAIKLIQAL